MNKTFDNLFLSVGAMKAGTTWLFAALSRHPELHFAIEKELHYFYHRDVNPKLLTPYYRHAKAQRKYLRLMAGEKAGPDVEASRLKRVLRNRLGRFLPPPKLDLSGLSEQNSAWVTHYLSDPVDDQWFNRLFPLSEGERYACEFSNLSAHLPAQSWRAIAEQTKRLKVLYTLRDPVKRLWSHTKFQLEMTGQLHLLETWKPADFEAFARKMAVWENGEYGRVCKVLTSVLPADALHVQFYEDMTAQPLETLRTIEAFLGVEPFAYPKWLLTRRPTKSVSMQMPAFYPSLFAEDTARIKEELGNCGVHVGERWVPD